MSCCGHLAATEKPNIILQGISGAVDLRDGHRKFIQSKTDKTVNDMGSGAKPCLQSISILLTGVGIPGSWIGWLEACEVGLPRVDCWWKKSKAILRGPDGFLIVEFC